MSEQEPEDSGSTLVHRGLNALTFTEMASFVHDIEARPLPRLLTDLPGLIELPDLKFQLVLMVLRKKVKEGSAEREPIVVRLRELLTTADDEEFRRRVELLLARPHD